MKWWIPLLTAVSFSLWTTGLLLIQKFYFQQKLHSLKTFSWIEEQIDQLIERVIPDIALPFLPDSLLNRLKTQGSKEVKSLIPKVHRAISAKAKKVFILAILLSALFGTLIGFIIMFATRPESHT